MQQPGSTSLGQDMVLGKQAIANIQLVPEVATWTQSTFTLKLYPAALVTVFTFDCP